MKLPAYPCTKPSGAEWLGDVPEHWEVKRIKHLGSIRYGLGEPSEYVDEGLPFIRATDIKRGKINLDEVKKVRSEDVPWSRKPLLKLEEILVVRSGAYTGDSAIVSNSVAGCIAGYDMVLSVNRGQPTFVAWALLSKYLLQGQIYLERMRAAQPHLNAEELGGFLILTPPMPEQQAIATFLDRETGRVDRLVAKERELIERLKEKRTALISRTVTRGLPSAAARVAGLPENPPLKASGLDWLGEIPEHWEALTVRRRAKRIQTGGTPPTAEERYYEDGTVPWFGPGSFDDQIVVSQPIKLLNASAVKEGAARMFSAGATMVVTIGATLGKVSSLTEAGSCNQQITVIEFDNRSIHPRFAAYQLKRLEPALRAIAPSATLPILDQGEIADIALGVPPLPEQAAIAAYLDLETAKLDALVRKVEEAVERLQEYRTALITAAVTGKIDVRTAVNCAKTVETHED